MAGFVFLSVAYAWGMETREAQQFFFLLGGMILFGLILNNIWITLFLWWSVFLYAFFKFQIGHNYLINIFFGCLVYYLAKLSFKKEHIHFFINAVLWFCVLNLFYMFIQVLGLDWMFKERMDGIEGFVGWARHTSMTGFMGFKACMGMLMALCVPLLVSRPYKWGLIAGLGLFVPIYLSESSICVLAGIVGLLFALWYRIPSKVLKVPKKGLYTAFVVLLIGGAIFYAFKVDSTPTSINLRLVAWRGILEDTVIHPVTGWGMDSFRNITAQKKHLYVMNPTQTPKGNMYIDFLDNPHNLYISLMFEWGVLALIILGGLLRQYGLWFHKAIKAPNTIALAGFMIVALVVSFAQFPMFLSRIAVLIVMGAALFEVQVRT